MSQLFLKSQGSSCYASESPPPAPLAVLLLVSPCLRHHPSSSLIKIETLSQNLHVLLSPHGVSDPPAINSSFFSQPNVFTGTPSLPLFLDASAFSLTPQTGGINVFQVLSCTPCFPRCATPTQLLQSAARSMCGLLVID